MYISLTKHVYHTKKSSDWRRFRALKDARFYIQAVLKMKRDEQIEKDKKTAQRIQSIVKAAWLKRL